MVERVKKTVADAESRRYVANDEAGARKIINRTLRRRATAKQRIGVSYRVRELFDPGDWMQVKEGAELLSERLPLWRT